MTDIELREYIHTKILEDKFHNIPNEELYDWTQLLLHFFEGTHINWKTCKTEKIEILKLDDVFLKYLISIPNGTYQGQDTDQFVWMCGTDPNNDDDCVFPDDASIHLVLTAAAREVENRRWNNLVNKVEQAKNNYESN